MNGKHRVWFVVCLAAVSIIGLAGGVLLGEKEVAPAPEAGGGKEVAPAKELTLDLGGEVTMKLVLVPAGKFMMGSTQDQQDAAKKELAKAGIPDADLSDEGPQREVTISKPFYLGVYEVTQAQYEQIMGKNPSNFKDAKNPVETVSWDEAVEFCKKLSEKTGKKVHLPTEAQWEYACRAGSKTMFSFGDDVAELHKYGNYCDKSNTLGVPWQDKAHDDGHDKTAPVGSFKANAFGLYDMHGNVWEWCADGYQDSYKGLEDKDPPGPKDGTLRVLRGGGWFGTPVFCRSANRIRNVPGFRFSLIGLRVAVDSY